MFGSDKKTKLKSESIDPDNSLDLGDFSDVASNIESSADPSIKSYKMRTPVSNAFRGSLAGVRDKLISGSFVESTIRNSLPSEYGESMDSIGRIGNTIREEYDESVATIKPAIGNLAKSVNKLVPKNFERTREYLEELSSELIGGDSSYSAPSSEEQQKAGIESMMSQIFIKKEEQAGLERAEDKAESEIREDIKTKQWKNEFAVLNRISMDVARVSNYTENITQAYQKKSLELMFRQYFVSNETLRHSKEQSAITKILLEQIGKNTALPDYVKTKLSEDFKKAAAGKFGSMISGKLFGANEYIENGLKTLREKAKRTISDLTESITTAASTITDANDMLNSTSDEDREQYIEMGMTEEAEQTRASYMAGTVGGSLVGDKLGSWLGKILKEKASKNPALIRKVQSLARITKNPAELVEKLKEADLLKTDDDIFKEKSLGETASDWAKRLGKEILGSFSSKTSDGRINTSDGYGYSSSIEPAVFDNQFKKAVTDVMPGYMARILRELRSLRTGEDPSKLGLLSFDYSKGDFVKDITLRKRISHEIREKSNHRDYVHKTNKIVERLTGEVSLGEGFEAKPAVEVSENAKAALAKLVQELSDQDTGYSLDKLLTTPEKLKRLLGDGVDHSSVSNEVNSVVKRHLGWSLEGLDEDNKNKLTKELLDLRETQGEIRPLLESMAKLGQGKYLEQLGVLDQGVLSHSKFKDIRNGDLLSNNYPESREPVITEKPFDRYVRLFEEYKASFDEKVGAIVSKLNESVGTSDIFAKKDIKRVNSSDVLSRYKRLPTSKWKYKKERGLGENQHTGPMAQDLLREFGDDVAPDGKSIDLVSANGANMAAISALARKIDSSGSLDTQSDDSFMPVLLSIKDDTASISDKVGNLGSFIVSGINLNIEELGKNLSGTFSKLSENLGDKLVNVRDAVGSIKFPDITQIHQELDLDKLYDTMRSKELTYKLEKLLGKAKDSLVSSAKSGKTAVSDLASSVFENVVNPVFEKVKETIKGDQETVYDGAKKILSNTIGFVYDQSVKVKDKLTKLVTETLPDTLRSFKDLAGKLGSQLLDIVDSPTDIYVRGIDKPILRANLMKLGMYFSEDGTAISKPSDIKGPVYDKQGNVLVSQEDLASGLVDKYGNRIINVKDKLKDIALGLAGKAVTKSIESVKKLFNVITEKGSLLGNNAKDLFSFLGDKFSFGLGGKETHDVLVEIRDILDERLGKRVVGKRQGKNQQRQESSKNESNAANVKDDVKTTVQDTSVANKESGSSIIETAKAKFGKYVGTASDAASAVREKASEKIKEAEKKVTEARYSSSDNIIDKITGLGKNLSENGKTGELLAKGKGLLGNTNIGGIGKYAAAGMLGGPLGLAATHFISKRKKNTDQEVIQARAKEALAKGETHDKLTGLPLGLRAGSGSEVKQTPEDNLSQSKWKGRFSNLRRLAMAGSLASGGLAAPLLGGVALGSYGIEKIGEHVENERRKKAEDPNYKASYVPGWLKKTAKHGAILGTAAMTGPVGLGAAGAYYGGKGLKSLYDRHAEAGGSKLEFAKKIGKYGLYGAAGTFGGLPGMAGLYALNKYREKARLTEEETGKPSLMTKALGFIKKKSETPTVTSEALAAQQKKDSEEKTDPAKEKKNLFSKLRERFSKEKDKEIDSEKDKIKEAVKATTTAKYTSSENVLDLIAGKASGMYDKAKDALSTAADAKDLLKGSKAGGRLGGALRAGGSRLTSLAGRVVPYAARVVPFATSLAGTGVMSGAAASTAATVGTGAATLGSSLMAGGATALGTLGAILTSPVTLTALGVAAVGYGLYKGYKYATRNNASEFDKIRFAQYGFGPSLKDKFSYVKELESYLESDVLVKGSSPNLDERKLDVSKILGIFNVDKDNRGELDNFTKWFQNRFKPVFLGHIAIASSMSSSLDKLDSLEDQQKKDYIRQVSAIQVDFSDMAPPNKDIELTADKAVVDKVIEDAKKELKLEDSSATKEDSKTPAGTTPESVVNGRAKPVAGYTEASLTGVAKAIDDKKLEQGTQSAGKSISVTGTASDVNRGPVSAIEAIRFKTYGLREMKADKIENLRNLEKLVDEYVKPSASGTLEFTGEGSQVLLKLGKDFGVSGISNGRASNWLSWFKDRFLPAYLAYVSSGYKLTNRTKVSELDSSLSDSDKYSVALKIIGSDVWNKSDSPWYDESMNSDDSSTEDNLEYLRDKMKETKVREEKKERLSPEEIKKESGIEDFFSGITDGVEGGVDKLKSILGIGGGATASSQDKTISAPEQTQPTSAASGPLSDGSVADNFIKVKSGVDINGVNPALMKNFRGMAQEYGEKTGKQIQINSGKRSSEEQEKLFKANPSAAAPPGKSLHEFGLAIDASSSSMNEADKLGLLTKYGLTRPMSGEPWHVEPAGIQGNRELAKKDPAFAMSAIQKGASGDTKSMIADSARNAGLDPSLMLGVAELESGFKTDAKNSKSSAGGLFQMTDATWSEMISKHGSKYGLDKNASKNDPKANALMAAELMKSNRDVASKVTGGTASNADIYLANFLGQAGLKKFFSSDKNALGVDVFPVQAKSNPVFYDKGRPRTLAEIYEAQKSKLDKASSKYNTGKEESSEIGDNGSDSVPASEKEVLDQAKKGYVYGIPDSGDLAKYGGSNELFPTPKWYKSPEKAEAVLRGNKSEKSNDPQQPQQKAERNAPSAKLLALINRNKKQAEAPSEQTELKKTEHDERPQITKPTSVNQQKPPHYNDPEDNISSEERLEKAKNGLVYGWNPNGGSRDLFREKEWYASSKDASDVLKTTGTGASTAPKQIERQAPSEKLLRLFDKKTNTNQDQANQQPKEPKENAADPELEAAKERMRKRLDWADANTVKSSYEDHLKRANQQPQQKAERNAPSAKLLDLINRNKKQSEATVEQTEIKNTALEEQTQASKPSVGNQQKPPHYNDPEDNISKEERLEKAKNGLVYGWNPNGGSRDLFREKEWYASSKDASDVLKTTNGAVTPAVVPLSASTPKQTERQVPSEKLLKLFDKKTTTKQQQANQQPKETKVIDPDPEMEAAKERMRKRIDWADANTVKSSYEDHLKRTNQQPKEESALPDGVTGIAPPETNGDTQAEKPNKLDGLGSKLFGLATPFINNIRKSTNIRDLASAVIKGKGKDAGALFGNVVKENITGFRNKVTESAKTGITDYMLESNPAAKKYLDETLGKGKSLKDIAADELGNRAKGWLEENNPMAKNYLDNTVGKGTNATDVLGDELGKIINPSDSEKNKGLDPLTTGKTNGVTTDLLGDGIKSLVNGRNSGDVATGNTSVNEQTTNGQTKPALGPSFSVEPRTDKNARNPEIVSSSKLNSPESTIKDTGNIGGILKESLTVQQKTLALLEKAVSFFMEKGNQDSSKEEKEKPQETTNVNRSLPKSTIDLRKSSSA